jgi:hypothetical protein
MRLSDESLPRRFFECGFSYPRTRYFSLCGQRKVSKRKPPDAACSLRFSHLPGVVKRDFPVPLTTCGIPAAPLRAIPDKCSDARRGITGMGDCRRIVGWIRHTKPFNYLISKAFPCVVIHHNEVHHIRRVTTPRINSSNCLGKGFCAANHALRFARRTRSIRVAQHERLPEAVVSYDELSKSGSCAIDP